MLAAWGLFLLCALPFAANVCAAPLQIGTFEVDVTPPLGSPVAYAATRAIDDPISAEASSCWVPANRSCCALWTTWA